MADHSSRPSPPTTSPPPLSFVTATSLSDFKNKDTMRQVRRAVMQTYLNKAENDPNSTDVRVTRKRTGTRNKKARSPPSTSETPKSSSSSVGAEASAHSTRKDSRIDDASSVAAQESRSRSAIASTPVLKTEQDDTIAWNTSFSQQRAANEWQEFDVAHGATYGSHLRQVTPDRFSARPHLPSNDINTESLKYNRELPPPGSTYYDSRSTSQDIFSTPAAFLSSLNVTAPYSDIMAMSQAGANPPTDHDHRQTLDVLDVVPKMLKESLSNSAEAFSNANIAAVLQFLCGQLSSDHITKVPVHQAYLKHMVMERGGLEQIGESGVIPIHVSITDMEANFLRNEPPDPMYLAFARKYVEEHSDVKSLSPESPIFSRDPTMAVIATSKMCSAPTLQLVMHMRQLTDKFVEFSRLRTRTNNDVGRSAYAVDSTEHELNVIIHRIFMAIHNMPTAATPGHSGYQDQVYEAVRLASLLYAHAIWHQVPFHQASHVPCSSGHGSNCQSTPEMIQHAVGKTNLSEAWDRMAGVLYWVLLVAGAACHCEVGTTLSSQDINMLMSRGHSHHHRGVSTTSSSSSSGTSLPQQIRGGSAPVQQPQPQMMGSLSLRQHQPQQQQAATSSPEQPSRLFQQYLSEQYLNTVKTSGPPSFTSSQSGSRSHSPLHATHYSAPVSTAPSSAHYQGFPSSPPTETSDTKRGKRLRTSSPGPVSRSPMLRSSTTDAAPKSKEEQDRSFARNFLVANAVRCSILLRFEHTTAVVSSIMRMAEVRECLGRRGK